MTTTNSQGRIKRALDFLGAACLLLLLWPLLLLIALAIRLSMGAPVLFRQRRAGWHGRPFTLLKFRTMIQASNRSHSHPLNDNQRLTPLGRFLRKTSLDELPQLWNVVKGDMALVGPRPLFVEYLPKYTPEQHRRHEVRPGITGWAQINGRRLLTYSQRLKLDVWYVDNRNLRLDLKILCLTAFRPFSAQESVVDAMDQVDDMGFWPLGLKAQRNGSDAIGSLVAPTAAPATEPNNGNSAYPGNHDGGTRN